VDRVKQEGTLKPAEKHTPTPKDEGTQEPSPGTSGLTKDTEKYKSTGKAMILSPEGKLIPFRMMNKVQKDDGDRKEEGNTSDPHKYKYIL